MRIKYSKLYKTIESKDTQDNEIESAVWQMASILTTLLC